MKKVLKKRTGFTLVELLIVIIIIGILAGAMLLVAGSGTDKAEATKIISDLRGLKAAALMYYADNPNVGTLPDDAIDKLAVYMDRELDKDLYKFEVGVISGDANNGWFVGRMLGLDGKEASEGVKRKLADAATDVGLLGTNSVPDETTYPAYTITDDEVWMRAR